ncbi:MAG: CvpA family protein [Halieaceae bacterium]|nr:CvpA family protein [Halieaceae bacterium]
MNPQELEQQLAVATHGFNYVDWVIVAIVTLSMLVGLWRGLAREVMSLLGWLAAFVLANLLARSLAEAISHLLSDPAVRYILSWILIFIGVLAVSGVLTSLVSKQLRQPGFDIGNRLLGAGFGVLRGLVVVMVLVWLLRGMLPDAEEASLDRSRLMPTIDAVTTWVDDNIGHWLEAPVVTEAGERLVPDDML